MEEGGVWGLIGVKDEGEIGWNKMLFKTAVGCIEM